jgi:hypothetical protein
MGKANRFINDEQAQAGGAVTAVMTLIMVGAFIMVGLMVMSGIYDSTGLTENDTFYNASEEVASGAESAFTMSGTLMLIIIAGAVLSVLIGYFGYVR